MEVLKRLTKGSLTPLTKGALTPLAAVAAVRGEDPEVCRAALSKETINTRGLLEVRTSCISGAGLGTFATSSVPAGTALALYSGTYIPPVPVPPQDGAPPVQLYELDGDYIYCCEGGGFIDGQQQTQQQDTSRIGHMTNHAPEGQSPNAVSVTLCPFPEGHGVSQLPEGTPWYYDSELCDLVRVPTRVQLKGVAVVSLVDIRRDEEILYDYAIGPPDCWPAWFHPVDPQYLERAVQIARAKRGHTCVPE